MSNSITASIQSPKIREEEKAYEFVIESENELFRIMHEVKEALITLTKHMDDAEQKFKQSFKRKSKEQQRLIPPSNLTVNRPQLWLPTFNGNALEVVSGYEIALENYEVIRQWLSDKYGDPRQ
ncbi:hypothetical protein DINM_003505 [Dirofilaria immitis]|nr:hypothetical protein [Dirofilaria immitis]